jgi:5-methylcytosine-specific restriction endonuclease McrA
MKRLPKTPRARVKSALRQLWLRSRERAMALHRDAYTCQECGKKQSRRKGNEIKVEVHHLNGIEWEQMIDYIYRHLLVNYKELITMCKECHKEEGR